MPHTDAITPTDSQGSRITCLIVGAPGSPVVERMRKAFDQRGAYWMAAVPEAGARVSGFGPQPPQVPGYDGSWSQVRPVRVETAGVGELPTDSWPFLYLREPVVPALNLRGIAIVACLSLAILLAFAPPRAFRPEWNLCGVGQASQPDVSLERPTYFRAIRDAGALSGRMFFLGAGFMLLETKGVVHMALLFGSTWLVSSVVFAAILVMILLANLYAAIVRPRKTWPYYLLLAAALAVNVVVPMSAFLALAGPARVIASCTVVFLPVFFAGVVFAATFRDCPRPDIALGSNVGGVILGGLAENLSLILGFDHLLLVAAAFYGLSAVCNGGRKAAFAAPLPAA
jgi:hypothetical protein